MVTSCCAYNCNERYKAGGSISFHRFPSKDKMLFRAWCIALRRKNFRPTWASRVCSKHFTRDSFIGYGQLKIGAVPTLFDFGAKKKKDAFTSQNSHNTKKTNNRTPRPGKILDFQDNENTNSSSEMYSYEEQPNGVEIIKLKRENTDEESGMESSLQQSGTSETREDAVSVAKLVKIDSLPSNQYYNMVNENEILRQTIDHLNKKIERFKCMTNVLQSNELISEQAAEVLRCTIDM